MEIENIIKLENVTKTFGNTIAVSNISLCVKRGEWICLMGPSGSGKTTILSIIAGIIKPDRGNVFVAGRDITRMSEDELSIFRRENIGFVFQDFNLIPHLTSLENVMLAQYFHSVPDETEAIEVLREVGLMERLYHLPEQLSGGEQQRVSIARAIVNRPTILIADEPTGNLDRKNAEIIMEIFKNFQRIHKITIVVATHDEFVASHAQRIIYLRDGEIHTG